MTAAGRQWATKVLPIEEVRVHRDFQLRANGLTARHVTKLQRTLQAGKPLPPVRVAQVGRALYLVDGFHRLEAHRRNRRQTIAAEVARMSLPEAKEEARQANTTHGLNLNRADKLRLWEAFVAAGWHLEPDGVVRSARAIEADLAGTYSRETVRQKLRAMGLELNESDTANPWRDGEADEEALEAERAEEAADLLRAFGAIVPTLDDTDRSRLVGAARALVEALERGENGAAEREAVGNPLGI